MIKLSLLLVILLSTLIPFTVFGDTFCVEWDEKTTIFSNAKGNWNGETFTVRYFNDTGYNIYSSVDLYAGYDNGKTWSEQFSLGAIRADEWNTSHFSLPRKPTSLWYISVTEEYCVARREKTWLEKLKSL